MKLRLERDRTCGAEGCTFGRLYVDDVPFCWTLEDVEREHKVPGETAIPTGTYQIAITPSARFGRNLPLLVDVPGFSGVRIHPGNNAANTEGCLLVGDTPNISAGWLGDSRKAFNRLFPLLEQALKTDQVTVEIV